MKPTPLLDFWQKPADAGEPIAVFATTFALDTDFFEQNCLARFLEVSSVKEDNSSQIDDIVATVELHEALQKVHITVLADRSAPVQRTSLRWDLLSPQVATGLLHSKVSVLIWEKAVRVILGSANLTAAGYRRQIELALAADLGPQCLFTKEILETIADELSAYLVLVPGYDGKAGVFERAMGTLKLFRSRLAAQQNHSSRVRVAFAPTNAKAGPLDSFEDAWTGARPLRATHLSPFWDGKDQAALAATRRLLTGRPSSDRVQSVAVVLSPGGQTSFSSHLREVVDAVRELKPVDNEIRRLHAKCLLIESNEWVAALVGSSNHTKAGFGLVANPRHREMNIWIGAPVGSKEAKALQALIEMGKPVSADVELLESQDEDEVCLPSLPDCFGLCELKQRIEKGTWQLSLGIKSTPNMPSSWSVLLTDDGPKLLTHATWAESGNPSTIEIDLPPETFPMFVVVSWEGKQSSWAVVAADCYELPLGAHIASLRAEHLLKALASGRLLSQVLREELERQQTADPLSIPVELDPLKRFEVPGSLLRTGRSLAASLEAMERRLDKPLAGVLDTLRARLKSPLGPVFVAKKVSEAFASGAQSRAEALFTIAEIALVLGRVDCFRALDGVDRVQATQLLNDSLDELKNLTSSMGNLSTSLDAYAARAFEEARRCINC